VKRLDPLENQTDTRSGLGSLRDSELDALLDALKEEDEAVRNAKWAALSLCPKSERALAEIIAEIVEHSVSAVMRPFWSDELRPRTTGATGRDG
jgi:hypothetical protein